MEMPLSDQSMTDDSNTLLATDFYFKRYKTPPNQELLHNILGNAVPP